ncbi:hypothetical protein QAD02_023840, partial [Eretmocerus hayati]
LPQLAVLAKILCLLMVVMCGAVPSTVRSVSLYSTCSRGNVTVYGRTVKSTVRNEHNAPYQKMTTQSEDFSMKLYIFAEKSKRYICFSKRWKVISLPKKRRDEWCQFNEIYNGRYLRYRSVVDPNRYIGFNKNGKPMTSPRGRAECYNFIKENPFAVVERHNDLISSSKGGIKHRDLTRAEHRPSHNHHQGQSQSLGHHQIQNRQQNHQQQQQQQQQKQSQQQLRKHQVQLHSLKNLLVPSGAAAQLDGSNGRPTTTTQHRLRHWKTDATRRRHHSSIKY